jgi:hypothetical protein
MRKAVWLMVAFLGLVCFGLARSAGIAQSIMWERYLAAGERLQAQGRPVEAARWYQAAIRRAERFGPADPRLAVSLSRYAVFLHAAGQAAAAAPLEARAPAIRVRNGDPAGGRQEPPLAPVNRSPAPNHHP